MSKTITMILLTIMIGLVPGTTPLFTGPYPVLDAGVPIDVGYYGAPVMVDWNLDGAKDLICGQFSYGNIRYYQNIGPDTAPEFNGYELLRANGEVIQLPYG
ncbi:MAG: hypothetical protein ABIK47_04565 [candidate division WOR-3 bacterium]